MSHRYFVTGLAILLAAAPVLAGGNLQTPHLKMSPSLEILGVVLGKKPTLPACPASIDGHFDLVEWERRGSKTCLESGQWEKEWRAYIHRVHLGPDAASGWFPASCIYRLIVLDGKVVDVSITTDGMLTFDAVVSILRRHYGKQHDERKTNSLTWTAGKWTKRSSIHAEWRFRDLDVNFNGKSAAATIGQVDLLTPLFDAWYRKRATAKRSNEPRTAKKDG